jgi:hypothetical protein
VRIALYPLAVSILFGCVVCAWAVREYAVSVAPNSGEYLMVLPGMGLLLLGLSITTLILTVRHRCSLRTPEMIVLIFVGLLGLVPLTGIILYDCLR